MLLDWEGGAGAQEKAHSIPFTISCGARVMKSPISGVLPPRMTVFLRSAKIASSNTNWR
jgi:hypothetical protein